jgi:hypothetical protein
MPQAFIKAAQRTLMIPHRETAQRQLLQRAAQTAVRRR